MNETTGRVADELAIRTLIEAYSDAVFRRDADAWAATWAEDAVWVLMGNEVKGRATILATWKAAMAGFSFVGFFAVPGVIKVEGARAEARVYVHEVLVETGGRKRRVVGAYDDTFARTAAGWRFARRSYRILHED